MAGGERGKGALSHMTAGSADGLLDQMDEIGWAKLAERQQLLGPALDRLVHLLLGDSGREGDGRIREEEKKEWRMEQKV